MIILMLFFIITSPRYYHACCRSSTAVTFLHRSSSSSSSSSLSTLSTFGRQKQRERQQQLQQQQQQQSRPHTNNHHYYHTIKNDRQSPSSSCATTALYASIARQTTTTTTSSSSSSKKRTSNNNNNNTNKNTGGLRRLPVVKRSNEIISRAQKRTNWIQPDKSISNSRQRARKESTEKMDALTKELCVPLRDLVNGYKRELRRLHPFEKVVADLTTRARQKKDGVGLLDVLDEIHSSRKEILLHGRSWTAKAKSSPTARDAAQTIHEGTQSLSTLFDELLSRPLDDVISIQKSLRTVPAVRLDSPAVVLVGAPNVGKSSIVRAISSGRPEVDNYPFTTRGMTLGHVEVFWGGDDGDDGASSSVEGDENDDDDENDVPKKETFVANYAYSQLCQIMDSPGLLVRKDQTKRNEMEQLTLAAMQHLPTAVMYVMDFSGEAGDKCSSIEDQLTLRKEVRARFPRRPWIDVISKIDLGIVDGSQEALERIISSSENNNNTNERSCILLSIKEGTGVEELKTEVMRMLGEVRIVLDAMAAVDERMGDANKSGSVK